MKMIFPFYGETGDYEVFKTLMNCASLEELRIKCAVHGIDEEEWLIQEGMLWNLRHAPHGYESEDEQIDIP